MRPGLAPGEPKLKKIEQVLHGNFAVPVDVGVCAGVIAAGPREVRDQEVEEVLDADCAAVVEISEACNKELQGQSKVEIGRNDRRNLAARAENVEHVGLHDILNGNVVRHALAEDAKRDRPRWRRRGRVVAKTLSQNHRTSR